MKLIFLTFSSAVFIVFSTVIVQCADDKHAVQNAVSSSRVIFSNKHHGTISISNSLVLDEALIDGRYVIRYWNPNGQIWPEMQFANLRWDGSQPAESFRLSINGKDLTGGYEWIGAELSPDPSAWRVRCGDDGKPVSIVHSVVTLLNRLVGIQVKIHTRLDGSQFMIRWLEITNLNKKAVAITEVSPFSGMLWRHRDNEHLPKDFASPFIVAYNHSYDWGHEGDFYFDELPNGVIKIDGGKLGQSGWGRPAFWARNRCNGQTFVCELAWGGNYEFAFDSRINDKSNTSLFFKMGLSGWDEALRVLDAGETISTPSVHMALFHDNDDAIVQATHDHVRNVVLPEPVPNRTVEIEANHRGYLCDQENVHDIIKDIDVARSVGVEMYVVDAGWYGKEPNQWWNNAGDWFQGNWMGKNGGMKAISDYVHDKEMKFGLWVEIEAAGANTDLKKHHPGWLMTRDGKPIADGRVLDITKPEVQKFEKETIEHLVRDFKLDMYRIDHNHKISPSGNRQYQGFTEDLTWRYYDNFYKMIDQLRAEFPSLMFQNCAGGGGRLDWGTMARFNNTELSDFMRLPRGFKILNGVSMSLPPEILMRAFGTESGEQVLDGDTDTQLRHNFCRIIFRGIAPSTDELSPFLKKHILNYLEIYKDVIRPTMINGKVFHHTPMIPVTDNSPWCVLEYARTDRTTSVTVVMRTSPERTGNNPDVYLLLPRGIDPDVTYNVKLDSQGLSFNATGISIMEDGIKIRLEEPLTSELIIIQAIKQKL
jgi:alpha-galactosidase